ncbi:hypothetical protein E2C01_045104 [Portunus trituberculatus]|uniref:Uncharacterized protein n=1 Tax=Portunus trituberculatus TaxID=210409 RepID=A0A5B7G165_PORTR|nr:hypothetical protein [Portunus trituberculatus]
MKITPKHRGASPRMVNFAAATAIATYNAGYEGGFFSSLLNTEFTSSMQAYLQRKDKDIDTPVIRKMKQKFVRKSQTCSCDSSPLSVAIMRDPDTITRASLEFFLRKSRRHLATPRDSSGRIQP